MATYENEIAKEFVIYGSSRLGIYNGSTSEGKRTLGNKKYELSNHLGNVLSVISDNKIGIDNTADLIADIYEPYVVSESDYYPFGMAMQDRSFQNEEYLFAFQGQETNEELGTVHYKYREADIITGRFWSVDPLAFQYAYNSPFAFSENVVIHAIELEGLEKYQIVGRSFAPRGSFEGSGFEPEGDNRTKFSKANYKEVSARIHTRLTIDLDKTYVDKEIYSQESITIIGSKHDIDDQEIKAQRLDFAIKSEKITLVKGSYRAKNGTEAGPAIDIFFDYKMTVTDDNLVIDYKVSGNIFPAQETIIFDPSGQALFIGTSIAEGGPLFDVWGDGKVLFEGTMKIKTDAKGNFLEVQSGEYTYTIEEWNKGFIERRVWNQQQGREDYAEGN